MLLHTYLSRQQMFLIAAPYDHVRRASCSSDRQRQKHTAGNALRTHPTYPVELGGQHPLHGLDLPGEPPVRLAEAVGEVTPDAPLPHRPLAVPDAGLELLALDGERNTTRFYFLLDV